MRIAIGAFMHETNTFCPTPTTLDAFAVQRGEALLARSRGVRGYLGGMIAAAERLGVALVPTLAAGAGTWGTVAADAYAALRDELLAGLGAAGPLDAVCLGLHGATLAEGEDDPEGALLADVRGLVGPAVPLVATLDLHGNLTPRMVAHADALLGTHYYPHTDMYERGAEAVELAVRLARGAVRPAMHLVRLPMLIPPASTDIEPVAGINARCFDWEARPDLLDCAFYHGFPHTDSPVAAASVLATTDGDPALARRAAEDVARLLWARRGDFLAPPTSPADALALAADPATPGPVVIHDYADNPGGGGPGDGTHLLRALVEAGLNDACFGFVHDPETAAQAHDAGVGATIDVRLGGKTIPLHGAPLAARAYVKALTDGRFVIQSPMGRGALEDLGPMARLVIGGVDVLVSSAREQTLDPEVFVLHGIDVARYRVVALKGNQHFRAGFAGVAGRIVRADTPGLTTGDLAQLPYRRLPRPIWPLDDATPFALADEPT